MTDDSARRRMPFALLVTGLIVGALALLLALNTASAANELRRHDLSEKDTAIAAQVQQLRIQVAASGAPANLGAAARALGMVPAGRPAFVVIGTDGKAHVLGRPGPVTAPPTPAPVTKSKSKSPKPKTSKSKSPKPTKSPSTRSTGRSAGTPVRGRSASAGRGGASSRPSASRSAHPTPTPTPTLTLPGGTR